MSFDPIAYALARKNTIPRYVLKTETPFGNNHNKGGTTCLLTSSAIPKPIKR